MRDEQEGEEHQTSDDGRSDRGVVKPEQGVEDLAGGDALESEGRREGVGE